MLLLKARKARYILLVEYNGCRIIIILLRIEIEYFTKNTGKLNTSHLFIVSTM